MSRQFQQNAIDLLRIYAAAAVMLLHYTGYALYVVKVDSGTVVLQGIRAWAELTPGVVIFFAISGYLCAHSCAKYSTREFIRKRVLRLMPPIWLCTLVNVIALLVLTDVRLSELLPWILTQVVGLAWTPDVLKNFATGSVNGALWTVFVQLQLYLLLALANGLYRKRLCTGRNARIRTELFLWPALLLLCIAGNLFSAWIQNNSTYGETIDKLLSRTAIPYAIWFVLGVFLYHKREWLLRNAKQIFTVSTFIWLMWKLLRLPDPGYYTGIFTSCLLCLMALSFAYVMPAVRLKIDFTYEIFLYHWIVLNIWFAFDLMRLQRWYLSLLTFVIAVCAISFAENRLLQWQKMIWKNESTRHFQK